MGNGVLPHGPSYRAHPRLYPNIDHRFDCRDLFQRSVIHYGAYKAPSECRSVLNCEWPKETAR